ncbi:MAG: GNAT family N-acetyltransferase [Candidatus Obscuribacterales bacterium]|nr:GNAT family N-acetyltransferase [Steroidobacteraceae bacterium]
MQAEINALNLLSTRPDPFSTYEFYENYFRNYDLSKDGEDLQLLFLTAFIEGKLVGYAALKQVTHRIAGLRAKRLEYLVLHDTDRPHLVARPQDEAAVTEAFYTFLLSRKPEWSLFELQQQDDTSPLFPPPARFDHKGNWLREWPNLDTHSIPIRWHTLLEYFNAMNKKFRDNLRRQLRHLLTAGKVELLASSDPRVTPALFELYCAVEAQSWKAQANLSISTHPKRTEYYRGLLAAHQPMRVSIHVLLCDGAPIAGLINGSFLDGLYALHVVYDDRFSQLAPGSALLLMGMRQAIEGKYARFNLLGGFGYYKAHWLAESIPTRNGQIYRKGTLFFWRRLFGDLKRRVFSESSAEQQERFNKARREATPSKKIQLGESFRARQDAAALERFTMLIERVRSGDHEFLSSQGFAAALPFEAAEVRLTETPDSSRRELEVYEAAPAQAAARVTADV